MIDNHHSYCPRHPKHLRTRRCLCVRPPHRRIHRQWYKHGEPHCHRYELEYQPIGAGDYHECGGCKRGGYGCCCCGIRGLFLVKRVR